MCYEPIPITQQCLLGATDVVDSVVVSGQEYYLQFRLSMFQFLYFLFHLVVFCVEMNTEGMGFYSFFLEISVVDDMHNLFVVVFIH